MVSVATVTVVLMVQSPFFPPAPSNTTVCDEAGTEAPPAPLLVSDQLFESVQLPAPAETQYLAPVSIPTRVKFQFTLFPILGECETTIVSPAEALDRCTST